MTEDKKTAKKVKGAAKKKLAQRAGLDEIQERILRATSRKLAESIATGDNEGMKEPMTKMEADVSSIKEALVRLEPIITQMNNDVQGIKGSLKHVPTNYSITVTMIFFVLTILGVTGFFGVLLNAATELLK